MSKCPDCDFEISLNPEPARGDRLTCPNCRARLVVLRLDPVELDWAFQDPLPASDQTDQPERSE